jgi:glycosyltransferase involved in cell wall biosynthesis
VTALAGPDITVVIPVWDSYVDRYLAEAIASAGSQDLGVALLVVDNASEPPVTLPAGAALVVRTPRRVSVGDARNVGLEAAVTPYVVMWDADDVMPQGTIRKLRSALDSDPRIVLAAMSITEFPRQRAHHWPRPWTKALTGLPRAFLFANAIHSLVPTTGGVMFRRDEAIAAGGYADADGGDDWVLGVSLASRGHVRLLPTAGRLYRRHADSLSASWRAGDIRKHAGRVRLRLRSDASVPRIVRATVPLIHVAQLFVIYLLRPLRRALRPRADL